jgi:hypothetical protein
MPGGQKLLLDKAIKQHYSPCFDDGHRTIFMGLRD